MIGNKVVLKGRIDNKLLNNLTGTILAINGIGKLLIAINNWDKGHKGDSVRTPDNLRHLNTGRNCWWVPPSNIKSSIPCVPMTKQQLIIDKINYLDKKFKERKSNVSE